MDLRHFVALQSTSMSSICFLMEEWTRVAENTLFKTTLYRFALHNSFVWILVYFPLCIHLVFKMELIYSRPCPYLPSSVMIFCEHFPLLICFIFF